MPAYWADNFYKARLLLRRRFLSIRAWRASGLTSE
jgi:hypothetical protein